MMLPRSGAGLPPWRRQVMPWVMALVRLGAGWIVATTQLQALTTSPSFLQGPGGAPLRYGVVALLLAGLAAFAWPRSYLVGGALLAAGLVAGNWLWQRSGLPLDALLYPSLAVLAVLAGGEWFSRRMQRRLYRD